ncbi:Glutamate receptor ionotropic, delta-2 [Frankliniella fusca]|uniref:Glutamate receptor ionotropic, delta-2 n=1 Tax=Frankliniella fusca TaxID=407009 RepID=A0AAE1H3T3_9NEOP|nr:Glutamate receptor ionotropic, delta-2 [Frankliniella fusca]
MEDGVKTSFRCSAPWGRRADIAVGDTATANEAAAAAALLSAFLTPYKAGVVVIGRARWTGDLLRALPEDTPRVLLDNDVRYDEADRLVVTVQQTHHVLLVLMDAPRDLTRIRSLPLIRRALVWTRVARSPLEFLKDEIVTRHLRRTRRCGDETALALTDAYGDVHLYVGNNRTKCLVEGGPPIFLDRWSSGQQRWLRGAGAQLFPRFCDKWSPPPGPATTPLQLMTVGFQERVRNLAVFADDVAKYALKPRKVINTHYTTTGQTMDNVSSIFDVINTRFSNCSLDGMVFGYSLPMSSPEELSVVYTDRMSSIVVVVPAGLGPAISPLAAVALEFSPAVWLGTALAAIGTAATLAWALRRDRGDALLLALAPLLGQGPTPPPAASPALRPLLGAWLLVCVVLAAAYQGLLLGMLSSARLRGEIDSLQALDESGLPVQSNFDVFYTIDDKLSESLRQRVKISETAAIPTVVYQQAALSRERAFILFSDPATEGLIEKWTVHEKLVHTFQIESGIPRVFAFTHKDSELWAILTKMVGRERQAGMSRFVQRQEEFKAVLESRKIISSTDARACVRPLTLATLRPAFLFLAGGLSLATFVFVFVESLPRRVARLHATELPSKIALKRLSIVLYGPLREEKIRSNDFYNITYSYIAMVMLDLSAEITRRRG